MDRNDIVQGVLYGDGEVVSPTITKRRLRLFYLGENRNKGFFTKEFAEKLISTISYTPVKGEFLVDKNDFGGHTNDKTYEKIYGIVPENYNFSWEKHIEDSGEEKEYACVDVLIFTQMYEEALLITGKQQSLELYPPSIKGRWIETDGKTLFLYEDAHFLGLQILGDDKDPCYESSAFFALFEAIKDIEKLIGFSAQESGGKKSMIDFPKDTNAAAIFEALNPGFSQETGGTLRFVPTGIHESYTYYVDLETGRAYYSEYTSADGRLVMGEPQQVSSVIFTVEDSAKAKEIFGEELNFFEYAEKKDAAIKDFEETKDTLLKDFEAAKASFEATNLELTEKIENFELEISSLKTQNSELSKFQTDKENEEKKNTLTKFEAQITKETYDTISSKLDSFSVKDLEKELSYEAMKQTGIFSLANPRIPNNENEDGDSLTALLSKYQHKG